MRVHLMKHSAGISNSNSDNNTIYNKCTRADLRPRAQPALPL